jgi:flavocytochrome c
MKTKLVKVISLLLCFTLMFGLAACSKPSSSGSKLSFKAGTYKATAKGNNGDVNVEVKFDEKSIVSVKVLSHSETAGLSDAPIKNIPKGVVDGQTLAVDTVSGATNTSKAILAAIEDCVKQAGGDITALKTKSGSGNAAKTETKMTTDVVVIGAGGAGLAAAASANQNGAKVIVLEKLASTGGSTALSGGGISATGTKFQEEKGIKDTKDSWMKLWKERQATSNPKGKYPDYNVVDKFMDAAVVTTEWLADYVGHKYGSVEGFGMDPVQRIHFPEKVESTKGGTVLTQNIEKFVRGKEIEILTETPAKELLVDGKGNVVGVIAESKTSRITINAKKVILATGGYAKNEELLKKYIPEAAGTAELSWASAGSTGDGIVMAEKLGAALYEEPWIIGAGIGSKAPGTAALGMDWTRVYVNEKGERFMNEQIHYSIATNKLTEQDTTWMIVDSTEANAALVKSLETALSTGEVVKGDTFEALGKAMNVSTDTFVKTMDTFNKGVKSGKDAMGKEQKYLLSVEKAPYCAIKFYPRTMGTFAGVKTNENFQVLRADGSIINNLYASGECANKVMYNQVYMSGSAVQFALTSGRISGEHAAKNLK